MMIKFENLIQEDFVFTSEFVTDENGKPIVFYHGTDQMHIQSFDFKDSVRKEGWFGTMYKVKSGAIFFALKKNVAMQYARDRAKLHNSKRYKVYQVHLKIKNPLDLRELTEEKLKILMEAGFDAWEKFGVQDNQGFMSFPDIDLWRKEHGYPQKNFGDYEDMIDDEQFQYDYYYNLGNLNADPSQFWEVADNPKVIKNLMSEEYDGLICLEDGGGISVAVFNPEQIEMIKKQ